MKIYLKCPKKLVFVLSSKKPKGRKMQKVEKSYSVPGQ